MTVKIAGAILILLAGGGFGFCISAHRNRDIRLLKDIMRALVYMECELRYKLTPLPELFQKTSSVTTGPIGKLLQQIASTMEEQSAADIQAIVERVLVRNPDLPDSCRSAMLQLGKTLGCFSMEGQATELKALQDHCSQTLDQKTKERDKYVRCYETLGLCCGAALVIILL